MQVQFVSVGAVEVISISIPRRHRSPKLIIFLRVVGAVVASVAKVAGVHAHEIGERALAAIRQCAESGNTKLQLAKLKLPNHLPRRKPEHFNKDVE